MDLQSILPVVDPCVAAFPCKRRTLVVSERYSKNQALFGGIIEAFWRMVTYLAMVVAIIGLPNLGYAQQLPTASSNFPFTVKDLGTLGGRNSLATAINIAGQVTGQSETATGVIHAFLYDGRVMKDLGTLGGYGNTRAGSVGSAINDLGEVTGSAYNGFEPRAFLYSAGSMRDLGVLGPTDNSIGSIGTGINKSGQVAGWSGLGGSRPGFHAFLSSTGVMADLGDLGSSLSYARGVNVHGQVVGAAAVPFGEHAFLFSNGMMIDLGTLGGTSSFATAINDNGVVVGCSYIAGDAAQRAFLYANGVMKDLGTTAGLNTCAGGINRLGQVVGGYTTANGMPSSFMYSGGIMSDISPPGWSEFSASGINDEGTIVGTGTDRQGLQRALMLTPKTAPGVLYYGIGDSVASGHGLNDVGAGPCQQSPLHAYPRIVGRIQDLNLVDVGQSVTMENGQTIYLGCSGTSTGVREPATSHQMLSVQVTGVIADLRKRRETRSDFRALVSITVGANDYPWARIGLGQEGGPFMCQTRTNFESAVNQTARAIQDRLSDEVARLVAEGNLSIILTEYHNPFNTESFIFDLYGLFGVCPQMGKPEMYARTEYIVSALNRVMRTVILNIGEKGAVAATYEIFRLHASPSGPAKGFMSCGNAAPSYGATFVQAPQIEIDVDQSPIANVLAWVTKVKESDCFHPNERGHPAYARAVRDAARRLLRTP